MEHISTILERVLEDARKKKQKEVKKIAKELKI